MRKAAVLLALAALTIASPVVATAQASYKITSVHQIAPNALHYLLSRWTGAGSLEAKMRQLEVKINGKALNLEGPEGREGKEGARGEKGETGAIGATGETGAEGAEGAEGRASTIAGPQGPQGERGEQGPEGPEGPEGPTGERGETGARGAACEASNPACRGPVGPAGPRGEAGIASPTEIESLISRNTLSKQEVEELASRTMTAAFQIPFSASGIIHHGQTATLFRRNLLPGDYIITGSINFRSGSVEGRPQAPEEQVCVTYLGGSQIAETNTINPQEVSFRAPAYRNAETSAVIVATTGAVEREATLEVRCTNVMESGPQLTEPNGGNLVATGVTFR